MMSDSKAEKTSVEWFFNSPAASNFPQSRISPAALDLHVALSKFLDLFLAALPVVPEPERLAWTQLARDGIGFIERTRSEIKMMDAFELIRLLNSFATVAHPLRNSEPITLQVWNNFRRVLAALIMFAKESKDGNLKSTVLALVKRWEA